MSAATFSLPSILLLRLVPRLPAEAVVMSILGLVECAPSNGVRWLKRYFVNGHVAIGAGHISLVYVLLWARIARTL